MLSTERHIEMFLRHNKFTILVIIYGNKQCIHLKEKYFMLKYNPILPLLDILQTRIKCHFLKKKKKIG